MKSKSEINFISANESEELLLNWIGSKYKNELNSIKEEIKKSASSGFDKLNFQIESEKAFHIKRFLEFYNYQVKVFQPNEKQISDCSICW